MIYKYFKCLLMNFCRCGPIVFLAMFGCSSEAPEVPSAPVKAGQSESFSPFPKAASTSEPGRNSGETAVRPKFLNVAAASGIEFEYLEDRIPGRFFLPEVMGGGVAWCDFDLDGWLDLYLMNGAALDPANKLAVDGQPADHRDGLFRSKSGKQFFDASKLSGSDDTGYGQGCAAGDFDADGFEDLYLSNFGANALLFNNGDGTFSDVTKIAKVGDERWSSSAVWVDLNADGNLDLYSANYMNVTLENSESCRYGESTGYCGPGHYEGVPDAVYISAGDGTFRDMATELGFNTFAGKGLAVAVSDFDNDFRPDIYVANDMEANCLYRRVDAGGAEHPSGAALYEDVAPASGCAVSGEGMNEASMGIACADFDSDGLVDIYLTHYYQMKNTLYRNLGGLHFEDDSYRSGVAATSFPFLGFGVIPLDFNKDRFPDIFIANGHVLGPTVDPSAMTPQLLRNDGRGRFEDVSRAAGSYFEDVWLGRGVAGGDFDNDGDVDVAVTHIDRPFGLLRNETESNMGFVGVLLRSAERVPAHCARVSVSDGRQTSVQVLGAGGSYLSTSDHRLLFPVEATTTTVSMIVEWPSGRSDRYESLVSNCYWIIIEGQQPQVMVK